MGIGKQMTSRIQQYINDADHVDADWMADRWLAEVEQYIMHTYSDSEADRYRRAIDGSVDNPYDAIANAKGYLAALVDSQRAEQTARPNDRLDGSQILQLRDAIVEHFDETNWQELGLLTGCDKEINNHPRLLRSLSWGDSDYAGHALIFLQQMLGDKQANLQTILGYVSQKFDVFCDYVSSEPNPPRKILFAPSVFQVPESPIESDLVALMIPFQASFESVAGTIKKSSSTAGMRCLRANDLWENSVVVQDIFSLIYRSSIVICDFSGRNTNVFYEAGIAHTLGKHVIPLTQNEEDIPFDLRHHRYLSYLNNAQGLAELEARLHERLISLHSKVSQSPA